VDGELDAGNAREVEAHVAQCPECASQLLEIHQIRKAMVPDSLRYAVPSDLRSRIEGKLPAPRAVQASRRSVLKGLSIGASATALAASGVLVMVMRAGDERRI